MTITAEEFEAWRADPVTEWVMEGFESRAEVQERGWWDKSWNGGQCDPLLLHELRTRASSYREIANVSYEDIAEENE